MKTQFIAIIILIILGTNNHTIDESFTTRVLPDNAWVLDFNKNGDYEYYHWNCWGGTIILNNGKYDLKDGVLRLESIEKDPSYKNEIPKKLFYSKMSKKEFENLGKNLRKKVFAYYEKEIALNKKYIVLSRTKLNL